MYTHPFQAGNGINVEGIQSNEPKGKHFELHVEFECIYSVLISLKIRCFVSKWYTLL